MTLIFAVGGTLTLKDEDAVTYPCKLRDVAIDGGQPTEIDITTTSDTIRQTYVSTAEPDRLTADVLLEDTAATQTAYETMREYMATAEDLIIGLTLKNDESPPASHVVYDVTTPILGHIVDVQETSPREEAAGLSLVIKIKR